MTEQSRKIKAMALVLLLIGFINNWSFDYFNYVEELFKPPEKSEEDDKIRDRGEEENIWNSPEYVVEVLDFKGEENL